MDRLFFKEENSEVLNELKNNLDKKTLEYFLDNPGSWSQIINVIRNPRFIVGGSVVLGGAVITESVIVEQTHTSSVESTIQTLDHKFNPLEEKAIGKVLRAETAEAQKDAMDFLERISKLKRDERSAIVLDAFETKPKPVIDKLRASD